MFSRKYHISVVVLYQLFNGISIQGLFILVRVRDEIIVC